MAGGWGWALGLLGLALGSACARDASEPALPPPAAQPGAPTSLPQLTPDAGSPDAGSPLVGWVQQHAITRGFLQVRELDSDRLGGLVLIAAGDSVDLGGGPLEGSTDFAFARYTADGTHVWSRSFPQGPNAEGPSAAALAVTPGGDALVAGLYSGAPDLGGGPLPEGGFGQPLFLARFAPDGHHLWSRGFVSHLRIGGVRRTGFMGLGDLALDADGNLLVTGSFQGAVDFGTGTLGSEEAQTESHFFLAKLSPDGTALWATAFEEAIGDAGLSFGTAVAADTSGHVLVSGGSSPGEEVAGRAFIARFTPEGQRQWLHRFEGALPEGSISPRVRSLAAGPDGTVYFTGNFSRTVRFGGEELESRPPYFFDSGAGPDLLLGAFSAEGAPQWARELPDLGEGAAEQLWVEEDGTLLVRGVLLSVADLGTGPLLPGPFVARYSASGAPLAARTLDPRLQLDSAALQPGGRLALAGLLAAPAELDGQVRVPEGREDLLLLQLDLSRLSSSAPPLPPDTVGAAGTLGWVSHLSSADRERAGSMSLRALAGLPGGGFAAIGRSDFGTFGGPTLVGTSDFVLARYDAEGAHQWTRAFRRNLAGDGPRALALAVAPSGDLLVAGTYSGAPNLGGGPLPRARLAGALFLARFTSEGRHVWSRGFGPRREAGGDGLPASLSVAGLAVGPEGDAVLTGSLLGQVDFGAGPLGSASPEAGLRAFVARFDSAGRARWGRTLTQAADGAPVSEGSAVAVDAAGAVLVAGTTRSDFEAVETQAFVARLGAGGELQWARTLQSTRTLAVNSLAADAAGTVYFGGELRGELRFAGLTVRSKGGGQVPDLLLGALDSAGGERWVRELPEPGEGLVEELALDGAGQLLVRGRLLSAADLGLGPLRPGPFVARYAADGTLLGARTFDPHVSFSGLALQPDGSLVLGGTLDAAVDLDAERLTPRELTDLLYLQLLP